IYALYALCRHVDDAVDEAGWQNETDAVKAVWHWKRLLDEVYFKADTQIRKDAKNEALRITDYELREQNNFRRSNFDAKSVLLAWQNLLKTYKIPQNLPIELMKGVLMDTHIKRYETFEELYVYCYRVASTVGLMSSEIFGFSDKKTLEYAEALGIAMQLTNILRDVGEDAAMDRIYLPQEDLRRFKVTEKQIFDGEASANFIELIKFQIARAKSFYQKAERGVSLLEKDAHFTVLLALRLYAKILDEIEKQNFNVFAKRAHTDFRQKLFSIPKVWIEARDL
ncbi:MAG: phytoene/squalene synthase family protein, partial [Acidobacteria bacterium]|nr:phytoene/squalene synthase family protein [Acidobacteriota bacterium]